MHASLQRLVARRRPGVVCHPARHDVRGLLHFSTQHASGSARSSPVVAALEAKIRRFAPVDIGAPSTRCPQNERQALAKMVDAARLMDGLFLEQVWAGNVSAAGAARRRSDAGRPGRAALLPDQQGAVVAARSRRAVPRARASRVPAKPPQANFYPADATREEVDAWIGSLKGAAHAEADGLLHRHPPRRRRQAHGRAVQRRVSEHAGRRRRGAAARPPR